MKKAALHTLFALLLLFSAAGCFDEKISNDPACVLSFSTDIVSFDTVFTDKGTTTAMFSVYNRNKEAVRIESVTLADAARSGFFINVDGEKGPDVGSIVLDAKDSLLVFVEANIDPTDEKTPFLVRDSVVFLTNGVRQDVKLQAYGQNAVVFRNGKILSADTLFSAELPILIYDSLVVAPDVTWTLTEGTTLYLHDKAYLRIDGRMVAQGTADKRVTLRGDRTDNLFPDLPYDYYSGQWGGVHFGSGSYDNSWDFVDMHGSSWGIRIDSSDIAREKLTLNHTIVHNSAGTLISASHARINAYNCQLSNAGMSLLDLTACPSEWVHCTIVNYYFWDIISAPMLVFAGYDTTASAAPDLPAVSIANSIVTGLGTLMSPADIVGMPVTFDHCLFTVAGTDDDNFLSCVWEGDPDFVTTGTGADYVYYTIADSSSARGAGDVRYLNDTTAFDLFGVPRLTDGTPPDLGAANYVAPADDEPKPAE